MKKPEIVSGSGARHHSVGEQADPAAGGDRERDIAHAARQRGARAGQRPPERDALGQPAQAEEQQHRGDDLHQELRQREIGRGEPDEGHAYDETGAAREEQRDEAVELRLPGGAERAQARRPSTGSRNAGSSGAERQRPGREAAAPPHHSPGGERREDEQREAAAAAAACASAPQRGARSATRRRASARRRRRPSMGGRNGVRSRPRPSVALQDDEVEERAPGRGRRGSWRAAG